jgi:putative hydrolase of the HAD superfamily
MIKLICLDFFNTLAHYNPSREQLYVDVCADNGITLSLKTLARKITIGDLYWRDENRKSPIEKRNKIQQFRFYINYISKILKESGVKANTVLAAKILNRMKSMEWKFVAFDDAVPMLSLLKKKGYMLGLISNVDKNIDEVYQSLGFLEHLDFTVTSHEAGCDKPDPKIFMVALEKAGAKPEEAIYIGDQYHLDIVGARNAGIKPILIDRYDWFDDIDDCPRIKNLTELTAHLEAS